MNKSRDRWLWFLMIPLIIGACSTRLTPGPSPTAASNPTAAPSPTREAIPTTPTYTSQPTATFTVIVPTVTPTSTPPQTPTHRSILLKPQGVELAKNLSEPDELLVGPDGTVYVSDVSNGTIRQITADGQERVFLSGLNAPEGMVLLPDRSMLIVEQGQNRLLRWDPQTKQVEPWLSIENKTGKLGVDNIALDARPGSPPSLIIPDSPNNRLLRASLDGKQITEIARGLQRPVDAWVEPDGSILVVEENGAALDRIHPDGSIQKLANLPTPDDVVEDADGNIFVATLGDGAVHWITNQDVVLIQGISSPQGLALDPAGNLLVTDPGRHRLVKFVIH